MSRGTHIYFARPVGADGPIKIGMSSRPSTRAVNLASWCWLDIEVVAAIKGDHRLEAALHKHFRDHLLRREWFKPAPELLELINDIQSGKGIYRLRTGCFDDEYRCFCVDGKIRDHADVIQSFGGIAEFADKFGLTYRNAQKMHSTNNISKCHWPHVAEAAKDPNVTLEFLRQTSISRHKNLREVA